MEDQHVDYDIHMYLLELNLTCYMAFFRKMKLQMFLQLTEEDLINLKMNISVHRNRLLEFLNQFHCKPWDKMSLHLYLYDSSYTFYHGLTCVSKVADQIMIMTSTFHYIKKNVNNHFFENMFINDAQISEYINTLKSTEKELVNIKKRLLQLKTLAKKIKRENPLKIPPSYIGPKVTKNFYFKPIILSILLVCGMYLTKVQVYK
ncbi:uncharacterized protein LOC124956235 [Vespa velutina]|uniref:uncharacterized protein LOC124956235 n=1 Tax=Vespa velutina TaxID=202808 RepID=UPI001FB3D06C|nr:uncharacterized protein LOC124956235 [Vespa velutina]